MQMALKRTIMSNVSTQCLKKTDKGRSGNMEKVNGQKQN